MYNLMMTSVWIGSRWSKTYGKDACSPAVVQPLLRIRADRCPPKLQRGYDHLCRAGAPKGTVNVDGTGVGYGIRLSCGVWYAVRGCRLHSLTIAARAR